MDEIDLGYHFSDTDSIIVDSNMGRRHRPAPYVNNRPRSADGPGGRREAHAHSHWMPRAHQHFAVGLTKGQYVAVADYDPAMFSQSGRREMELPLREGDHVIVTGLSALLFISKCIHKNIEVLSLKMIIICLCSLKLNSLF